MLRTGPYKRSKLTEYLCNCPLCWVEALKGDITTILVHVLLQNLRNIYIIVG